MSSLRHKSSGGAISCKEWERLTNRYSRINEFNPALWRSQLCSACMFTLRPLISIRCFQFKKVMNNHLQEGGLYFLSVCFTQSASSWSMSVLWLHVSIRKRHLQPNNLQIVIFHRLIKQENTSHLMKIFPYDCISHNHQN